MIVGRSSTSVHARDEKNHTFTIINITFFCSGCCCVPVLQLEVNERLSHFSVLIITCVGKVERPQAVAGQSWLERSANDLQPRAVG